MVQVTVGEEIDSNAAGRSIKARTSLIILGFSVVLSIVMVALAAATLGVVVNRLDSTHRTDSSEDNRPFSFADQIKSDDLMQHLGQLQVIADESDGTRAIGTQGFNNTLNYITYTLQRNTKLIIHHEYFTVPNCVVQGTPLLQSQINGVVNGHVYLTDFTHIIFSPGTNFDSFVRLTSIPNFGCQDSDWMAVTVQNSVALVKRGDCTFPQKSQLAEKYQAKGLFIYNDGTSPGHFQAFQNVRAHINTTIPGYFLSFNLGMMFVSAASNVTGNASIRMKIDVKDAEGVGNICADTPTGDRTRTIVVGSHSDGVLDGSGINDNGKKNVCERMNSDNLMP